MANIVKTEKAATAVVQKQSKVAQANVLTQSRYDFTVVEKRAIYCIIREVRRRYIEQNDGQRNLFDNLEIRLSTADLLRHNLELKAVYKALLNLRRKTLFIETEDNVLGVGYINYFNHKKYENFIEVEVSKKILPYLVELAEKYTEYDLLIAITLQTKYSQRFYEYCSQYRNLGYFKMQVEDLRRKLMLEDKYDRYALLKKYVIEVAQRELQALYEKGHCDIYFTYSGDPKEARSPKLLNFTVIAKQTEAEKANTLSLMDCRYKIREHLDRWLKTKSRPTNKVWVDEVMKTLDRAPDKIVKLYKRLEKLIAEEPNKNHAAIARFIIKEDYLSDKLGKDVIV